MIKETVGEHQFIDAFKSSDTYKNSFSYNGLKALYDYLWDLSEDIGEDIELDVVAICCDYSEHRSALECAIEYGYQESQTCDEEKDALNWLQDRTQVIQVSGYDYSNGIKNAPLIKSIIVQSF